MLKADIDGFIKLVEEADYVEAHEVMEDNWRDLKKQGRKAEAKYLQALINGATALALFYIKKRPEPGERVWQVYLRNKYLFDELELFEKEKYFYVQTLLEERYEQKN
jgi:predicted metal-dependent hydrolase